MSLTSTRSTIPSARQAIRSLCAAATGVLLAQTLVLAQSP
jgi:hypothetical protein